MTEQWAEHFTRFAAKYCLKTWQEQQEEDNTPDGNCYLKYICRLEQTFYVLTFPIKMQYRYA